MQSTTSRALYKAVSFVLLLALVLANVAPVAAAGIQSPASAPASSNTNIFVDANLYQLTLAFGMMLPGFNSEQTTGYTATVGNAVDQIKVIPTVSDSAATIQVRVNGGDYATATSGVASGGLPLNVGDNPVDVKVTGRDSVTTKTYTITITRSAPGAQITVQSNTDHAANIADCPGVSCTLRDAVTAAKASDTIVFASDMTINLTAGQISFLRDLTIDGSGHTVVINGPAQGCTGAGCFRVFNNDNTIVAFSLKNLTMMHGFANSNPIDHGGAIYNAGMLIIDHVTFDGNVSVGSAGAVQNDGIATITNSTFTNNTSAHMHAGAIGINGPTTISGSTFANNTAIVAGGAIAYDNPVELHITNSTFYNNQATFSNAMGGAIAAGAGTLFLTNVTLSGNAANWGANLMTGSDAGVSLVNTILANPVDGGNCFLEAALTLDAHNLSSDDSCGLSANNGSLIGVNPLLANLGDYGGPTQTLALLPGSPAIDTGTTDDGASSVDQRGVDRPKIMAADMGAFESQGFTFSNITGGNQATSVNTAFADPLTLHVDTVDPNEPVASGKVTFTAPGSGPSINPAVLVAAIGPDGSVSQSVTANDSTSFYTVIAGAVGVLGTANYSLTNQSPDSTGPSLASLTLADGDLDPEFQSDVYEYTANVANSVDSVTFTASPTASSAYMEYLINGAHDELYGGQATGPFALNVGDNTLEVRVFADDDITYQAYIVTIHRAAATSTDASLASLTVSNGALDPEFDPGTYEYTDNVDLSVSDISLIANATDTENAAVQVDINGAGYFTAYPDEETAKLSLNIGKNTIHVRVTAENVETQLVYTITVNRGVVGGPATITVESAADGAAAPALCPGANCTLRDAIEAANSGDTVAFAGDMTIDLTAGELPIAKDLTIDGGFNTVVVNGPGAACASNCFRVFNVTDAVTLTLKNLTVANGSAGDAQGGAILNDAGGALVVDLVTFNDNSANYGGGAIYNSASAEITDSIFNHNVTGPSRPGGAVDNEGGVMSITGSTFQNNFAGYGGAIAQTSDDGSALTVKDSTLAGNQASGNGGGISFYHGSATLLNDTLSGNLSGFGANLFGSFFGGYSITNTILANPTGDQNCEMFTPLALDANNLADDSSCGLSADNNSLSGVDPLLAALGNYDCPTPTLALLPGSPAIDAGLNDGCFATNDQRGYARPVDGICDIGAFESHGFHFFSPTGDGQTAALSAPFTNPLTVRVRPVYENEPVNGGVITFISPDTGASTNPAVNNATIQNGTASLSPTANNVAGTYDVSVWAMGILGKAQKFSLTNGNPISTDATLAGVTTNHGTLAPSFTPGQTAYNLELDYANTSIAFISATHDAGASMQIRVNKGSYTDLSSGAPSQDLPLLVGSNTVEIKVTAADGTTTQVYTFTIVRKGSKILVLFAWTH